MLDRVPYVFYVVRMDWDFAIERHRVPLLGHVMGLFVMIGLTEGGTVEATLPGGAPGLADGGIGGQAPDHRRGAQHRDGTSRKAHRAGGAQKPRQKQRPMQR